MTRRIIAIVTAATIAMAASAPLVQAQGADVGMGFNMLTGAIYNELKARGLRTDNINELTLSQIVIIKGILDSDDGEGKKTNNIKAILNR